MVEDTVRWRANKRAGQKGACKLCLRAWKSNGSPFKGWKGNGERGLLMWLDLCFKTITLAFQYINYVLEDQERMQGTSQNATEAAQGRNDGCLN